MEAGLVEPEEELAGLGTGLEVELEAGLGTGLEIGPAVGPVVPLVGEAAPAVGAISCPLVDTAVAVGEGAELEQATTSQRNEESTTIGNTLDIMEGNSFNRISADQPEDRRAKL